MSDWVAAGGGVAAEYGDYTEDEFGPSSAYLKPLKLLPQQTEHIEMKIMEHHKDHLYDNIHYYSAVNGVFFAPQLRGEAQSLQKGGKRVGKCFASVYTDCRNLSNPESASEVSSQWKCCRGAGERLLGTVLSDCLQWSLASFGITAGANVIRLRPWL